MVVNEIERQSFEAEILAQLEEEHRVRVQRESERAERERQRMSKESERERRRVERKLREQFYKENGYKRYENSRGETEWLMPQEYDRRMARRRRHSRRKRKAAEKRTLRYVLVASSVCLALAAVMVFVMMRG